MSTLTFGARRAPEPTSSKYSRISAGETFYYPVSSRLDTRADLLLTRTKTSHVWTEKWVYVNRGRARTEKSRKYDITSQLIGRVKLKPVICMTAAANVVTRHAIYSCPPRPFVNFLFLISVGFASPRRSNSSSVAVEGCSTQSSAG